MGWWQILKTWWQARKEVKERASLVDLFKQVGNLSDLEIQEALKLKKLASELKQNLESGNDAQALGLYRTFQSELERFVEGDRVIEGLDHSKIEKLMARMLERYKQKETEEANIQPNQVPA